MDRKASIRSRPIHIGAIYLPIPIPHRPRPTLSNETRDCNPPKRRKRQRKWRRPDPPRGVMGKNSSGVRASAASSPRKRPPKERGNGSQKSAKGTELGGLLAWAPPPKQHLAARGVVMMRVETKPRNATRKTTSVCWAGPYPKTGVGPYQARTFGPRYLTTNGIADDERPTIFGP